MPLYRWYRERSLAVKSGSTTALTVHREGSFECELDDEVDHRDTPQGFSGEGSGGLETWWSSGGSRVYRCLAEKSPGVTSVWRTDHETAHAAIKGA